MASTHPTTRERIVTLRFLIKWTIVSSVVCVGVGVGVYTALALSGTGAAPHSSITVDPQENQTNLDVGEDFPDYTLTNVFDSSSTRVSELTGHGPVLLAFVSNSCSACEMMKGYWKKRVLPKVDSGIQIVFVYDGAESAPRVNDLAQFGVKLVSTNRREQLSSDGIASTPTLVGLGHDRRIVLITTGFNRKFGSSDINALIK